MKGIIFSILLLSAVAILLFTHKKTPREKIVHNKSVIDSDKYVKPEVKKVRNTDYQIMESATKNTKVYLDVLIQEKLTEEELIEIARKEWVLHGKRLYMSVSFRYFSYNNPTYGEASYFVDCEGCEGMERYGKPIEANIFYKEPEEPETINILPEGIDSSNVIARFYNHASGDNALIAYTNDEKTKASYFSLHKDYNYKIYKHSKEKLIPKDNMVFKIIETGAKYQVLNDRVEYIQTNGYISYTFQMNK